MTTKRLFSALLLLALFAMGVRETLDADMWWHLKTGEYILQHGIPRTDVFSFTVPHHEWITHEWLSQVIMWLIYRAAGFPGLIIVFAALITLTFWLVYTVSGGRPYLAGFVVLLAAIASAIVWGARPQIFNLLLMAAFVHVIERVKKGTLSPGWLWLLPPLTLIWANLHSGYLLGVVLLGTYAVGETVQRWWQPLDNRSQPWPIIGRLWLATAAAFLLAAVNPSGPAIWLYPFDTLGSAVMQRYITEWHSPDFHQAHFVPFAALLLVGIVVWVFSPKRPSASELLLLLGTAAAGLLSARHIPLFTIVAAPIIANHLALALTPYPALAPLLTNASHNPPPPLRWQRLNWLLLLVAAAAALGWTAQKVAGNEAAIAELYPVAAVDYLIDADLATAPGYNSYNWGGYLIWRELPVFVDGRADVYGDDFLRLYLQAYELTANWQAPLAQFDVDYVLMERGSRLSTVLQATGDWQLIYEDELAHILVPNGR